MKRILFMFLALLSVITVSAKDDVRLKSGSLLEIKNAGKSKVFIVWDYSKATIEKQPVAEYLKQKGADWEKSYPTELKEAEKEFSETVNESKYIEVTTNKADAQYVITIQMADFNYGSTGVSVLVGLGAGDARFSGNVLFTKGGATIAELDVDGVPGNGYGNERRRKNAYEELGEWIVKLIKKAK